MVQLQGFPCFNNTFTLYWLHHFPGLLTFFPWQIYRVSPVLVISMLLFFKEQGNPCYNKLKDFQALQA